MYEVIVVGAGPAGLGAALWLGRCRRRVLVCDTGAPRNAASRGVHGFLTRDGVPPMELRRVGREELRRYETVEYRDVEVIDAEARERGYEVLLADRTRHDCRFLLLATGVIDVLPEVAGMREFYGRGVHHCPYCDGWELRDQPLAVYCTDETSVAYALELLQWSCNVTLLTDGKTPPNAEERAAIESHGVALRTERIAKLEGEAGELSRVRFLDGGSLPCRGLFFSPKQYQKSPLADKLGCVFTEDGAVKVGQFQITNVPNLYVVGDAAWRVQFAIIAAAEGAKAAVAIDKRLREESLQR